MIGNPKMKILHYIEITVRIILKWILTKYSNRVSIGFNVSYGYGNELSSLITGREFLTR
jgi:hypothetical protein